MKGVPLPARLRRRPIKINPSYYGLEYEEISFLSRKCESRALLRGWYIPSPGSQKCIIMIHGWRANRTHPEAGLLEIAKALVSRGYNVLTFDLRGHGESEGNKVSFGCYEAYDVLGAFDFIVKKKNIPPQNIGLMGFSYGAMVSILAAGKENISGVIADSGPGDTLAFIEKFTAKKVAKFFTPLFYPVKFLTKILMWVMGIWFGINVNELDTGAAVKRISTPIFFIYGTRDNVPYCLVQKLYQIKKRHPLDKIWVADARHTEIYRTYPRQYLEKVIKFFNAALKPASK